MATTKKPTKTKIKRNDNKFTFSWNCADKDYGDGQQVQYSINWDEMGWSTWMNLSVSASARTRSVTINMSPYWPTGNGIFNAIRFRVRGNRKTYEESYKAKNSKGKTVTKTRKVKPGWSGWSDASYDVKRPNPQKSITSALSSTTQNNVVFSWKTTVSNTKPKWFRRIRYESILVEDCNTEKKAKAKAWSSKNAGWATGTDSRANGSVTITNDSAVLARKGQSWSRWIRMKSMGPQGNSDWTYCQYIFAQPNAPKISQSSATILSSGATEVYVKWVTGNSAGARPIANTTVEYLITTPLAGMLPPNDPQWTPVMLPIKDPNTAALRFKLQSQIGPDEVLFVHVVNHYGGYDGISDPVIPTGAGATGALKPPTLDNVITDDRTFEATVTATNNSDVPDSWLAVYYRELSNPTQYQFIGVIPHGETTVDVQAPNWTGKTAQFGVQAFVGTYVRNEGDFVTYALEEAKMQSDVIWNNGLIPVAPENVTAGPTIVNGVGTIHVTWDWTWEAATGAVISWADHEDAWMSTDEPDEFEISQIHASEWNISGLETGKTWFVRVRLYSGVGDNKNYGSWSEIIPVGLKSAPTTPFMMLSEEVITTTGTVEASWAYTTTDGTPQAQAQICTCTIANDGTITYGDVIATAGSAQHVTLSAETLGWSVGETYNLCVQVTSASGETSDSWSNPVPISIANEATITEVSKSLVEMEVPDDDEEGTTETVLALRELPLTARFSGAGDGGTTTLTITRLQTYPMDRPTEDEVIGYEGEIIASKQGENDDEVSIGLSDLVGRLDDGAWYNLNARVEDVYGQTAEEDYEFKVVWSVQAQMPEATVREEDGAIVITPTAPAEYDAGDRIDIYRLSADKPELIYPDAEFGQSYVDPFPAINEHGGHRLVYRTQNGDYITPAGDLAFLDMKFNEGDYIETNRGLIDFGGIQIPLLLNVDVSSQWDKAFEEKTFLGGSVKGFWNPGTSRTGSISTEIINLEDQDVIDDMRRLAVWDRPVHVRTLDGSSFWANVDVQEERRHDTLNKWTSFQLQFTRIDPPGYDGLKYSEWKQGESE